MVNPLRNDQMILAKIGQNIIRLHYQLHPITAYDTLIMLADRDVNGIVQS